MKLKQYLAATLIALSGAGFSVAGDLPDSLDGQTFLFQLDSTRGGQDPEANFVYIISYEQDTYTYQVAGTGQVFRGRYLYQHVQGKDDTLEAGMLSHLEVPEVNPAMYQMILLPKDSATGSYLFKQTSGPVKSDIILDTARYTRVLY